MQSSRYTLEADGSLTVLVEQYLGKRLNSPNDAVHHSSGALYFTDPPYGLVGQDNDPAKDSTSMVCSGLTVSFVCSIAI